ncbi:MAG: hypothetical protein QNL91_15270 [Candidatus Krumholzibacteria bacterium]|nr:hypothetical protein [Candidatus Krumholzibacteria bacterium]
MALEPLKIGTAEQEAEQDSSREIVEAGAERLGAGRESSRSSRLPHDSPEMVHPFARFEKIEMQPERVNRQLPVVAIFAESGPLAGDLAACLSGRFRVDRVTSLQGALKSISSGCRALLILRGTQDEFGPACTDLVKQAVADSCRVLILGSGGLGLESELGAKVVCLPPLPSPQILFENLSDLEASAQA